jgi:class 3 adenylate cyclase/predicted ATPase
MDIVVWLRSLGLGKYEAAFRENEITEKVLPNLTAEDLKDLGISIVGHRRTLLDAIAALRSDASGKTPSVDAATASSAPSAHPEDRAERRQVTVMFSDLVGSTALSARMDPEDLREIISAYQRCVAETVQHFGGFVAKYMGDGVLVYFGYPQAHEDDAERAVRAGLELVAAVGDLKTHAPLKTRVGIATGLVVVGDLIGSGASQEQAIVGETPNLAARLQGIAEPNSVVIAESTRKLVGNLFELEDLGSQELKGMSGRVRAWAALRPASVESRFEALHASGLTELVGREEELELLLRRWSKGKSGEGQVVLLSGEPGIGKSRLTAALLERVANEPHTRLRYFCSPQRTDSALYPIISQMERAARFAHDDTVQVKLDKLDALLTQSSTPPGDAALFSEMLSLPNDGRYPVLELTPQQRRQKTLEALFAQVETIARESPVLMVLEDAHWTDPTSLEAFGRTMDRIKSLRVLLIVTYRPEFEPPWIGRPYVAALTLNRLGEREIAAIIDGLTGDTPLPESVRQDIAERTDGIPLFIEEMTRAVLEAESESDARKTTSAVPSSTLAVPASLHASLMARLDRLGPAKEVAQIGAAIGREFSHALLAAVAIKDEKALQSALDALKRAGLLLRQGVPPSASYLFKHALIQDAAYGTLLREPRRALHARIAEALESGFADAAKNQPEILARHCTEAGQIEKAANLWGEAGQRSLERSALVEATAQFTQGLDLIARLPATPALRREQIKLQVALITPLIHVKGHAAAETKAAVERARFLIEQSESLGEPLEDSLILFVVLWGSWVNKYVAFDGKANRELAAQFLALAQTQKSDGPRMIGHRLVGTSALQAGEIAQARMHYDHALKLYDPSKHRYLASRFGQDVRVATLSYRALALWVLGYPDAAMSDAESAIRDARETGQAVSLMYALMMASLTQLLCGAYATAQAIIEELVALADEKRAVLWRSCCTMMQGQLLLMSGKAPAAIQTIDAGLSAFRSTGATLFVPNFLSWLITAYAEAGRPDDARHCVGEALALVETGGEKWLEAEINRIAGEVARLSPERDTAKAEVDFEHALSVARQQQAKSFELRASMSLARLWRDQGKVQQARELLAPVYGWFTEGFDTRDLKEARALLEQLAA